MTTTASLKNIPVSPKKLAPITSIVRGTKVAEALLMLPHLNKQGAIHVEKLLKSALSNAVQQEAAAEDLVIESMYATQGPSKVFRRFRPAARGRTKLYKKLRANLFVTLTDGK